MDENRTCQSCKQEFTVFKEDQIFYDKIQVPPPTFCPKCRSIRRNVWRGERKLYKRKCDLCSKDFIFMYPENTPFPVYCRECWHSDNWDPKTYGKEYDFNKPFFEQWKELFDTIPRVGSVKQGMSVNSEYTNRVTDMRNCYLVFATTVAENSRYSAVINESKEVLDCYNTFQCEQSSELVDCSRCFNTHYAQESQECRDSMFLYNCRNVSNCFGCVNMRNVQYCWFNEQLDKEEYEKRLQQVLQGGEFALEGAKQKLKELRLKYIVPSMVLINNTKDVSGNWIDDAKLAFKVFNVRNVENVRYVQTVFDAKDCMDYTQWGNNSELMYETASNGIQCARVKFGNESWSQLMDAEYCTNCHKSQYLFGCNGLRDSQYCILNKQYTKEEFETLIPKIKQHMNDMPYTDKIGRVYKYGEFYPEEFCPFPYNETIAQEFYPTTKENAASEGHWWQDPEPKEYQIGGDIIACEHKAQCNQSCTTAFRVLPEDREFYEKHKLPLPKLCPNCRHFERIAKRTPLALWPGKCQCAGAQSDNNLYANTATQHAPHGPDQHCPNEFETSYSPEGTEIVYCIECYNAEIV